MRSQEVRLASWCGFDLEGRLWTVLAEHMKRGKSHGAVLSRAALEVLFKAHAFRLPDAEVVFPGDVQQADVRHDTAEGGARYERAIPCAWLRSTFTDWAANEGFAYAVVEAGLAHKTPDAVQAGPPIAGQPIFAPRKPGACE